MVKISQICIYSSKIIEAVVFTICHTTPLNKMYLLFKFLTQLVGKIAFIGFLSMFYAYVLFMVTATMLVEVIGHRNVLWNIQDNFGSNWPGDVREDFF